MNLTKVDGTYSKELYEHMNDIRRFSFSEYTSTENLRDYVLEIIEPAWINAAAKKRFIEYLEDCESKKSIYWLCHNTVQKAMKHSNSKHRAY